MLLLLETERLAHVNSLYHANRFFTNDPKTNRDAFFFFASSNQ